jgi:hypothetical protein
MIFLFFVPLLVRWLLVYTFCVHGTSCVHGVFNAFNDILITYKKKSVIGLNSLILVWYLCIVCLKET